MKNNLIRSLFTLLFLLAALASGCTKKADKCPVVATVNDYQVTTEDFRQEAKMTFSAASKDQILQDLIVKELLLEEAQKMNIDKDKYFMKEIETYWKQALIKRVISIKGNEFLAASKGTPKEKMENAQKMLNDWIDGLKKNACIRKNDDVLNKIQLKKKPVMQNTLPAGRQGGTTDAK